MFRHNKIKHFKVKQGLFGQELWIKYGGEQEIFLTSGKVDLADFKEKQKPYLRAAYKKRNESAKSGKKRHENYLYFKGLTNISK